MAAIILDGWCDVERTKLAERLSMATGWEIVTIEERPDDPMWYLDWVPDDNDNIIVNGYVLTALRNNLGSYPQNKIGYLCAKIGNRIDINYHICMNMMENFVTLPFEVIINAGQNHNYVLGDDGEILAVHHGGMTRKAQLQSPVINRHFRYEYYSKRNEIMRTYAR